MKRFILCAALFGFLSNAMPVELVQAREIAEEKPSILFENGSSYHISFYIDGHFCEGVPSGDRSVNTWTVEAGTHKLKAVFTVGTEQRYIERTVTVYNGDKKTWTITDN